MRQLVWLLAHGFLMMNEVTANEPEKDQCCKQLQLSISESVSSHSGNRMMGHYNMNTASQYIQYMKWKKKDMSMGVPKLYKYEGKAWYFGIDSYTSGIRSEDTIDCPEKVTTWTFWDIDKERWINVTQNEIMVNCVSDHNTINAMNKWKESAQSEEDDIFSYTKHDVPNVDCKNLNISDPAYPPHPRIVLLGATGVGKSTLSNQLLGCYKKDKDCNVFSIGHGYESHTTDTSWAVGNYLGKGGCVTIIDTPGVSDSGHRDYEHAVEMANLMKNDLKSVDVFLLVFKGNDDRFMSYITEFLELYEDIFSKDMWKHVITEITYWKWDENSVEDRMDDRAMNAERKHSEWNKAYKNKLSVAIDQITTVFIDPVFPLFSKKETKQRKVKKQTEALEKFTYYTSLLWHLANSMPKFHCKESCNAPSEYYSGEPWVTKPILKGRLGSSQTLVCQIWKAKSSNKSTRNIKWKFNDTIIYTRERKTIQSQSTYIETRNKNWSDYFNVNVNENKHFVELRLELNLTSETKGVYSCDNSQGSSDIQMLLIVDGNWANWEEWGQCSTSCLIEGGEVGVKIRRRECIMPQHGGKACDVEHSEEQEMCAGEKAYFSFCPIDHKLSEWTSWSECSVPCGVGRKQRYRQCSPARHGGKICPERRSLEESNGCNEKPCPACNLKEWGDWSSCSLSCLDTQGLNSLGVKTRDRAYEEKDPGKPVCNKDDNKEKTFCAGDNANQITNCPINSEWTLWSQFGICSVTCGEGTKRRRRSCNSEQYGGSTCADLKINGKGEDEVSPCNKDPCKIPCITSVWSAWGKCDHNCGTGTKRRTRKVDQTPRFAAEGCGSLEETEACFDKVCPPCGKYRKQWTSWTSCSGKAKMQTRKKSIDLKKQKSEFTGMDCSGLGDLEETRTCPVNCKWSTWSNWRFGFCTKTCDGGTKQNNRDRTIKVYPQGDGEKCEGKAYEMKTVECNKDISCYALTSYGDRCTSECLHRGESYSYCWTNKSWGKCSMKTNFSITGKRCISTCSYNGESYTWCITIRNQYLNDDWEHCSRF